MCRWVAYSGNPIAPELLLYDTDNSLVEQSRRDRLAGGYPNADGFGLGWYGKRDVPGLYRSVAPAWGDRNLRELAAQIESPLFLAHIRAATGTPIEQTNCHPFRHGRWLFMHNGFIDDYLRLRRELVLAVDPHFFPGHRGHDGLGADVPPRADVRARAGAAHRARAHGRVRRGHRTPPRRRRAAADDRRRERRRAAVRRPLRERPGRQLAVRHRRCATASAPCIPRRPASRPSPTRRWRSSPSRSATCTASGSRCRPAPR